MSKYISLCEFSLHSHLPQKMTLIDIILDCEVCQVSSDIKRCQVMSSDDKVCHMLCYCAVWADC